ncbi:unnamed protein product [Linum trigynum]|uniref:Reverse transcriptase zinc-binding domain-containing protein n=1 Tax=Linum trigynum TaxID=586398 RepID=A0AAV2DF15_9ROSI
MTMVDGIVTKDKLLKWGKVVNGLCVLCNAEMEPRDHMFFRCVYARRMLADLHFGSLCRDSWVAIVAPGIHSCRRPIADRVDGLIWCIYCAGLWKERSRCVHGTSVRIAEELVRETILDLNFVSRNNECLEEGLRVVGLDQV